MKILDWLLTENGICSPCKSVREWDLITNEYRLYRFLTEVEDVVRLAVEQETPETDFLVPLRKLVRKLILNSYWVKTSLPEPNQTTGTSFLMLYDELGFPMTVQTEVNLSGTTSPIHNHGTWEIVAMLQGKQKNIFWKRNPSSEFPDKIEKIGEQILVPGEIISFTTEAIHSIEAIAEEPTVTFNIYGETYGSKRFQFDPTNHLAKHF